MTFLEQLEAFCAANPEVAQNWLEKARKVLDQKGKGNVPYDKAKIEAAIRGFRELLEIAKELNDFHKEEVERAMAQEIVATIDSSGKLGKGKTWEEIHKPLIIARGGQRLVSLTVDHGNLRTSWTTDRGGLVRFRTEDRLVAERTAALAGGDLVDESGQTKGKCSPATSE